MLKLKPLSLVILVLVSQASLARGLGELRPHKQPNVSRLKNPDHWMVIIGDSGATGSGGYKNLKPNALNLLGHVTDFLFEPERTHRTPPLRDFVNPQRFNIQSVEPLTRIVYSMAEFEEAAKKGDVASLNLGAKGSLAIDAQESTNGYLIGRTLGIDAADIVMVAQGGTRVNSIATQFQRIYEMQTHTLPPLVLMSYTANDFCHPKIFTDPLEQLRSRFKESLQQSWQKSERYLHAHSKGTRIVVLAALDVANVLTNESIMNQKVQFQGGQTTCGNVRRGEVQGMLSETTLNALSSMCKSVLQTKPTDLDRLARIRTIQNEFNEIWKQQIAELNAKFHDKKIEWTYVESVRDIKFEEGDVGNDCFHPGGNGHARIADHVLREVFGK